MITVPFLFVSEETALVGEKLSVSNMFENYYYKEDEVFIEEIVVSIGLIGKQSDDEKTVFLRITGKGIEDFIKDLPIKFHFLGNGSINYYNLKIGNFPIFKDQTIYLEVHGSGKLLNKFPLSFKKQGEAGN